MTDYASLVAYIREEYNDLNYIFDDVTPNDARYYYRQLKELKERMDLFMIQCVNGDNTCIEDNQKEWDMLRNNIKLLRNKYEKKAYN